MSTIWHSFECEFVTSTTAHLYFMSAERTERFRDIDTITTMRTFFISDKSFENILRRVESSLYSIYDVSKYSDDNEWPEELDEIQERCKITEKIYQSLQNRMRNQIPAEESSYLEYDESIGKGCHRKNHCMGTVFDLLF